MENYLLAFYEPNEVEWIMDLLDFFNGGGMGFVKAVLDLTLSTMPYDEFFDFVYRWFLG